MFRAVLAALLALTVAACGQPEEPAKGVVNLYTARHYDADLQLYAAFTEKTGIKVNRLEMEPDQLIERMKAQASKWFVAPSPVPKAIHSTPMRARAKRPRCAFSVIGIVQACCT